MNTCVVYATDSQNGAAARDLGLIFDFLVDLVESLAFFCLCFLNKCYTSHCLVWHSFSFLSFTSCLKCVSKFLNIEFWLDLSII